MYHFCFQLRVLVLLGVRMRDSGVVGMLLLFCWAPIERNRVPVEFLNRKVKVGLNIVDNVACPIDLFRR